MYVARVVVRVLTWNLKHGRSVPSAGPTCSTEFAAALAGWEWDLALLQEVPPWWPPRWPRDLDADAPPRAHLAQRAPPAAARDRHPLARPDQVERRRRQRDPGPRRRDRRAPGAAPVHLARAALGARGAAARCRRLGRRTCTAGGRRPRCRHRRGRPRCAGPATLRWCWAATSTSAQLALDGFAVPPAGTTWTTVRPAASRPRRRRGARPGPAFRSRAGGGHARRRASATISGVSPSKIGIAMTTGYWFRLARSPKPRSISSAFSPERPARRAGPRAGWRRRRGRRSRGRAAAVRARSRSRRSQCTTTNRLVAGRPSSGARWVAEQLARRGDEVLVGAGARRSAPRGRRETPPTAARRARPSASSALERLRGQRVLVVDPAAHTASNAAGSLPRPGRLPAVDQLVDGHRAEVRQRRAVEVDRSHGGRRTRAAPRRASRPRRSAGAESGPRRAPARPASTASRIARAIATGSWAREIALAHSTASQPSSIASAASEAVPTPGVEDHRHPGALDDDRDVVRVADPHPAADRRAERHHRGAADVLEPAGQHRVVGGVREHDEAVVDERLGRGDELDRVGQQRAVVADHLELDPVGARTPRGRAAR